MHGARNQTANMQGRPNEAGAPREEHANPGSPDRMHGNGGDMHGNGDDMHHHKKHHPHHEDHGDMR